MPSNRRVNARDEIIFARGSWAIWSQRCEVCKGVDVNNQMRRRRAYGLTAAQLLRWQNRLRTVLKSDQKWQQYRQRVARRLYILPTSVSRHTLSGIELVRSDQLLWKHTLFLLYDKTVCQSKDWTNQDIVWYMMKMIWNQEYMLLSTGRSTLRNHLHLWVSTQIFFYLKIEQMNVQQFEKQSGYELWHRRMAHSTNQKIRDSISCTIGMESLIGQKYESHVKCPSCMIGKATLEDFPSLKKESGTAIVSNQHGFIFIISQICRRISACCGVGRQPDRIWWIYGIKTKDETIKVVKQWYSYIADLRARHKLVTAGGSYVRQCQRK